MNNKKTLTSTFFGILMAGLLVGIGFLLADINIPRYLIAILIVSYFLNLACGFIILVSKVRTDTVKACWLFVIILLPIVGLILFFFFGVIPFKKKDYNEYENVFGNVDIKDVEESKKIIKNETKWNAYKLNFNTMHSPIYTDTKIDIIKNNNDILKQYIDLVRSAKETIYIQTYVIKKSVFFYTLANEMAKKAKQGVKVYFVYDWAGSYRKFNSKVIRMLDKAGVHVAVFNYNRWIPIKSSINFRSHQKMLIVDSKVCFYGSSNITEEYLQINTNRNIFFDINYIITGKIINSLIDTFIYNFKKYTNASEEVKKQLKFRKAIENKDNGSSTQLVLGYPDCKYDNINFSVLSIINTAKKSITIVNPFLLPTNEIVQALKIAAWRGVKIKIILPHRNSDKNYSLLINRYLYADWIKNNIEVYEFNMFVHTKFIIADEELCFFGSSNLDHRSLMINFENSILFKDKEFAGELKDIYDSYEKYSLKVDKAFIKKYVPLRKRVGHQLLQIYKPLV